MDAPRNDRIYLFTRIVAAAVILVLLLAFVALYIFPTHTDVDFAWTIQPATSAILMGAGYTAGAFFFVRLLADKKWHHFQAGFLAITAFTICMLAATLLHLGRFHQGALNFYLWTGIYAVTPVLVPVIWLINRRTDPGTLETNDYRFSAFIRWAMGIVAVMGILAFIVMFFRPAILIAVAAWKLTELTARVFAGWSILTLTSVLMIALDGRWSAARVLLESALVGLFLSLLSLPRMWSDLDFSKVTSYLFIAGIVGTLMVFVVIHIWLDRVSRRKTQKQPQPVMDKTNS